MNLFKQTKILKEAKKALTLLFTQIVEEIELDGHAIVFDRDSLKSKLERGFVYYDTPIDEFKRSFQNAYGDSMYYHLLEFYRSKLLIPYMETKKPKRQEFIDAYEKMKNEIIQRGLLL